MEHRRPPLPQAPGWTPLYNSFYAGTQIGHGGSIVSGTTFGVMEMDGN